MEQMSQSTDHMLGFISGVYGRIIGKPEGSGVSESHSSFSMTPVDFWHGRTQDLFLQLAL